MLKRIANNTIKYLQKFKIIPSRQICVARYKRKFHRLPDLNNPKDINEKILWLEFNTDTSKWSQLADKFLVRDYVQEKGFEDMLVKLYGVYKNANEIDFNSLPSKFVIKANNGCGTVMIVNDKSKLDIRKTIKTLNGWLKEPFGYLTGEIHYTKIEPRIIIEEFLENDSANSSSLIDYKFWCFNGKVFCCFVCGNRNITNHNVDFIIYDIDPWMRRPDVMHPSFKNDFNVPKPKSLLEMVAAAERISADFPIVRIDFYEVNGKPYFGEMTFTSNGGRMRYFTDDYLLELGNQVNL